MLIGAAQGSFKIRLIVFLTHDYYEKLHQQVTEMLIRGKKLNISNVLIPISSFKAPKVVILNSGHYPIMKTPNRSGFSK